MSHLFSILTEILSQHAGKRVNGRVASDRSATAAGEVLKTCFKNLLSIGYKLEDPRNIKQKHIEALCKYWHAKGRSPKTMQGYLSHLRIFCRWIGKGELVLSLPEYLPLVPRGDLKVRTFPGRSKSWTEHGIDIAEKIRLADDLDWRLGLMLRMQLAFGLRRLEVIQVKPWKNDCGDKFSAYATKGGRPRDIYINTPEQRAVLDLVKQKIKKWESLGWVTTRNGELATLEYSVARYAKLLPRIGITKEYAMVTGHGLRAQYAENAALIASLIPPTLGGTGGQMPKEDLTLKRAQVSELLGHSRISVTSAYYGGFGRNAPPDCADRAQINISRGVQLVSQKNLKRVPSERLGDCMRLGHELALIEVYASPAQVQALWEKHSMRHGVEWTQPLDANLAALEAAALSISGANP